ncbi:MAG TPA: EAL domain-containing protein [Thermoanaerobaculia bacterium]|nr:EAL domain-containing protein [Thermoanaerobaculia bacterium]
MSEAKDTATAYLSKDRIALGVTALGLAFLAPSLLPGVPQSLVGAFNDRLSDPLMIAVVLAVVAAGASRVNSLRERRFWALLVAGLISFLIVQVIDVFVPLAKVSGALLQVRNLFYVGLYAFFAMALDASPHLPDDAGPARRALVRLETAGVLVLGLGLFAYFSVLPALLGKAQPGSMSVLSLLLFVAFDVYLILRTGDALRATADPRWKATFGFLLGGQLFWLVSDGTEALWHAGFIPDLKAEGILDAAWLPPFLGIAFAARLRGWVSPLRDGALGGNRPVSREARLQGPLWFHAAALPVVHLLLDAAGVVDPVVEPYQRVCVLSVFAINAVLADVSRRRLETVNAKLEVAQGRAIELERRAHRDALTGLPNRYPLLEHIERTIAQARRTGSRTAVVLIDIERFRVVNDSIGHSIGDALLLAVAERLARAMRSSDMLGRLGGDEFVVVASDASEPGDARRIGRRLLDGLSEPFRVEGTEFLVNPSIGVSLFPTDGSDADTLLRNANLAMCHAQAAGGDRVDVFDPERHVESMSLLSLEASLRKASIATQFVLHYQPIVELPSRAVVGFEALLRWRHPERGLLLPAEFLEVAETSGVLARLTPWVLREACLEASRWPGSEDSSFSISLNLSARQFLDADLAEHVEAALRRSSLPGRSLVLEISERLAMQHVSLMRRSLDLLKGLGVRIAIDDFGTGYSSLASLRALPIDILKIDRSFVHGLGLSDADEEITETILAMSRALRLVSVAEGVETNAQLEILIAHGCRRAQGYLFGPPAAAAGVAKYVGAISLP